MSESIFVRLKPYNKKQGFLRKRYHYKRQLYACDPETQRPLWYQLDSVKDAELIDDLAEQRQDETNPASPYLFDVVDQENYDELCGEEERRRLVELGIMSPSMVQPAGKTPKAVDRRYSGDDSNASSGRAAAVPEPEIAAPSPVEQVIPDPVPVQEAVKVAEAVEEKAPEHATVSIGHHVSLADSLKATDSHGDMTTADLKSDDEKVEEEPVAPPKRKRGRPRKKRS